MTISVDEDGLTIREKLFCDEYCQNSNAYRSYIKVYTVKENTKKHTVEREAERLVRKPRLQEYIKKKRLELSERTRINTDYFVEVLCEIIENNRGKPSANRSIELLGRLHGVWWDKPTRKIEEDIPLDDNTESMKKILYLLKNGSITEESATTWIHLLNQKSNVNERENINKEILEKIDQINSRISDKSN